MKLLLKLVLIIVDTLCGYAAASMILAIYRLVYYAFAWSLLQKCSLIIFWTLLAWYAFCVIFNAADTILKATFSSHTEHHKND